MLARLAAAVAILGAATFLTGSLSGTGPLARPAAAEARIWAPPGRLLHLDGAEGRVQSLLRVTGPMRYGDFVWRENGVPPGPIWVRVDRRAQILSVFRGPHEIGTTVILYGATSKPTPAGRFPILARERDHKSSLYNADMPYALRLTGDGVFVHASAVRGGRATHGCIGVPDAFAKKLFDMVRRGDMVVIV